MARKIRAKFIMELRDQGMSRRSIAKTRHMSMGSVCEAFDIAGDRGITWDQVKGIGDERVYELFYPDRNVRESVFEEPDWSYAHAEMAKVGFNLRLLHDEYKSKCSRGHMVAMGYTRFCERYGDYTAANNLTKRIEHKAGVSCEVDWSGPTNGRGLVNPITREVSKIYLFVGVLPFSQKAYFEPTLDMRERTWLCCYVHMYEFWGGVPQCSVGRLHKHACADACGTQACRGRYRRAIFTSLDDTTEARCRWNGESLLLKNKRRATDRMNLDIAHLSLRLNISIENSRNLKTRQGAQIRHLYCHEQQVIIYLCIDRVSSV